LKLIANSWEWKGGTGEGNRRHSTPFGCKCSRCQRLNQEPQNIAIFENFADQVLYFENLWGPLGQKTAFLKKTQKGKFFWDISRFRTLV
jgi:hypothetical protein